MTPRSRHAKLGLGAIDALQLRSSTAAYDGLSLMVLVTKTRLSALMIWPNWAPCNSCRNGLARLADCSVRCQNELPDHGLGYCPATHGARVSRPAYGGESRNRASSCLTRDS